MPSTTIRRIATDAVSRADGLAKTYAEGKLHTPVFDGLDLDVHAGETVAIVGASGAGKSTLLHLLGGLDTPTAGEVYVAGQQMSALSDAARGRLRNRALGFVYQFHHLLPEFTALENVMLPVLLGGTAVADAAQARRRRCSNRSASAIASNTSRANCPAASASAPRWRARWSTGRPACSATSRPATSTRKPRRPCSS